MTPAAGLPAGLRGTDRPVTDQAVASRRAGTTAAVLYALGGAYMQLTASQLPERAADRIWLPALVAGATAGVLLLVPWARLPATATLLPPLWAFVVLYAPIGLYAGALSHYLLLYTLLFLYVGLTQRRGTALVLLPLALLSLLPVRDEASVQPPLFLVGPVVVAVVLAEIVAWLLAQQRRAQASLAALVTATAQLQGATTTRDAADVIAEVCCSLLGADSVAVLLHEQPGSSRLVNANTARAALPPGQIAVDVAGAPSGTRAALTAGQVLFAADAPHDPRVDQALVGLVGAASVLFVPLGSYGSHEGVAVAVFRRRRRRIDPSAQRAAEVLAVQAEQVLRRVRESALLHDLAVTDALTGLPNRRVFFSELSRLRPGDAIVFLDLDHFKAVNDTRGHQGGDAVLRSFASVLGEGLRADDVAGRYGGEEFALLLPHTSVEQSLALVDRLRASWAARAPGITFSAGIAVHEQRSPTETLAAADAALYLAKSDGRNTAHVAAPTPGDADVLRLDRRRSSGA